MTVREVNSGSTGSISATNYQGVGTGSDRVGTVEAIPSMTVRSAGVYSYLYIRVSVNTRNGDWTVRFRNNGSNGNQVVTVTASTTGEFEDTTHTDTVAAGDIVGISLTPAGSSGATTFSASALSFTATTNTVMRYLARYSGSGQNAGQTTYAALPEKGLGVATVESSSQIKFKTAGTLKNMGVYVYANTLSGTCTFRSRIGGANGNMAISVSAAATGVFEDTSNSDSISVDSLVNYSFVTAAGSGAIVLTTAWSEFETTGTTTQLVGAQTAGTTVATSQTGYSALGGAYMWDATEANAQVKAIQACTLSKLAVNIAANTISAASSLRTRINGNYGNLNVAIGSSTTGWLEDASSSDVITATDEVCLELKTGASGTSMSPRGYSILATFPSGTVVPIFLHHMRQQGMA